MLTCSIGENIVNTIDYSDSDIRKWSDKKILKCPACGEIMIYKNGRIKIPHFAHVSKCCVQYSENESNEHINGKIAIYEWLKTQHVENLKLEAWIPETKQRPDIYFELNGKKYVIEYQCTPISSEFIIRRELYKLAGIVDIWILGTENYDVFTEVDIDVKNYKDYMRTKTIERELYHSDSRVLYLKDSKIISIDSFNYNGTATIVDVSATFIQNFRKHNISELINNELEIDDMKNIEYLEEELKSICKKLKRKNIWKTWYNYNISPFDFTIKITKENEEYPIFNSNLENITSEDLLKFFKLETENIKHENKFRRIFDKIVDSECFLLLQKTKGTLNTIKHFEVDIEYEVDYDVTDNYIPILKLLKNNEPIFKTSLIDFDLNILKDIFIKEKQNIESLNKQKRLEIRHLKIGGYNETKQ